MTDYFELGQVLRPQGIKGEVKLAAYTDDLSRFSYLDQVLLRQKDGAYAPIGVLSARVDAQFAYLKLEGYEDRDAAETLRGKTLYVDRAHAARLPEGAFYVQDLIGLAVQDEKGTALGVLREILQNGAADVYVVEAEGRTCMFPAIPSVVLKRDVQDGTIIVDAERLAEVCVYDNL